MPRYRIHRIKDGPCESFRWAPHTGGTSVVKPRDYEPWGEVDATSPYAVWKQLLDGEQALRPGDLLESVMPDGSAGELQIAKYIGFEPAHWFVPEPKAPEQQPVVVGTQEENQSSSSQ